MVLGVWEWEWEWVRVGGYRGGVGVRMEGGLGRGGVRWGWVKLGFVACGI